MPASISQSRKTLGSGQFDARRNKTPSPGAGDEAPPPNGNPVNQKMSESQTSAAARRTPSRMRSEERRLRPQRKASVGSPDGSTTSGSSRRGKRFSIGESDNEDDDDESDSDSYPRSSRSRFRSSPDQSSVDDSFSSSGPSRSSSRAVRQQPPTYRDPSRGRRPNRSRNRAASRAASKATATDGRRPAQDGPSPSSTARSTPVPGQSGLLRRTMSSRELPSHRRESNADQDGGRPNLKRATSHHNLESHSRDLLQSGQERPPPPPLPVVIPEPEPVRQRRGQYPFESFMGEDPTLETKASEVVRSRSQSRGRPITRVAAVASAAAAFAAAIPPPPPVPARATAMYPAASFIGEGAFRGASVSAPTSSNSSPVEGPPKPPPPKRSASTPPRRLRRAGTAPVGIPLTAIQGAKIVPAPARAASSASTTRSANSKRSLSTPPAPARNRRPTATQDPVEGEAAAKRIMQGLPQVPHPPSRRPSMYPFESYVGEDPTAETLACVRSKSIRVPASTKKFATGPFVPGAATAAADAAATTISTPRRPGTALYPASSFVGEDDMIKATSGADKGPATTAMPKPRVLPAGGSAPKAASVDNAAATVIMGGEIVASPTEIGTMHVGAPRLSLRALPSAIRLDEKRVFGDLADDEDSRAINKPAVPVAITVGVAISDDDVFSQVDGSDEKSDDSNPRKGPPARPVRNTDAASPVENASATPFAATAAPNEFVDLEKALPIPQSTARSYDGSSIQKVPGAAASPPALRSGEMTWFYNPGMGTKGPRAWKKRTWGLLAGLVAVIIIVAVAVPVSQQQAELARRAWFNTYPDYARLNYSLSDNYSGAKFFDNFNYFTGYDPTGGHVHYVPRPHAEQLNLTYATESSAVVRVDATVGPGDVPNASTGRFSVRLESKRQYDRGLFVFDVAHTPHGCGTWPALWMSSPHNWPLDGEIDVMEATNKGDDGNLFSLHTTRGCEMNRRRDMTGVAKQTDCYNGTNSNQGCNVAGPRESYGQAFNARGGGVLAVELRDQGIRMWQFARPDVPRDLAAGAGATAAPDPASWGAAAADFPSTDCDVGAHFRNQSIIINITLCGQLTEALWGSSECPGTCVKHVSDNPDAFRDAFWQFNSLRVYKAARS
ncbi:hypothetical protein RB595_006703 [Gaeumannomyces hyphopodioides]